MKLKKIIYTVILTLVLSSCANKPAEENTETVNSGSDEYEYFKNTDAQIVFKYSKELKEGVYNQDGLKLEIRIDKIEGLEGTLGFDEPTAKRNEEYLKNSFYGEEVDAPYIESKNLRRLKNIIAQDYIVFSRYEVCDVRLERFLYFFSDGYQIVVGLAMDPVILRNQLPDFFVSDTENCGNLARWDIDKQRQFYELITSNERDERLAKWLNNFEYIMNSIESFDKSSSDETEDYSIVGSWISVSDPNYKIEFTTSERIEYMQGKEVKRNIYETKTDTQTEIDQIVIVEDETIFNYSIIQLNEDSLKLMFLPRGNILEFKKDVQ